MVVRKEEQGKERSVATRMMQGGRVCKSFGGSEDGLIISKEDEVEEEGGRGGGGEGG